MSRADQISRLQNDLHINHFHEIGAGALAEKLYDAGYRLIPELTLLTDEEIEKIVVTESRKEGFDNDKGYIRVRPEDYVKAGSLAQRDSCEKRYLERLQEIKSELEEILIHGIPEYWESFWKGLGV